MPVLVPYNILIFTSKYQVPVYRRYLSHAGRYILVHSCTLLLQVLIFATVLNLVSGYGAYSNLLLQY
eukprot:SAG31_NODE_189_length_20842_cov_12.518151_9_plen_67_part_00